MPTRSILIRVAFAVVLMAALVALADGVVQRELGQAAGVVVEAAAVADAQPAGANDGE